MTSRGLRRLRGPERRRRALRVPVRPGFAGPSGIYDPRTRGLELRVFRVIRGS
jgi:hypothetical protein